ncbi:Isochorismatase [Corynebacterium capitovis DSM 44611]|uniref:phosphopantetheine-binding protein n=1 Tax=Corynebacterium capitovis TaxID=131081 RepID=UPI00036FD6C4|nr:phosphopantetheine-binding protein [Corynebacterium capitovis]WKD57316.1 Isochorismatase [Corynebacterium capitovis DSM 44611]
MALSEATIIADIAEAVGAAPGGVDKNAPLEDQGLDSLGIVDLAEKWRSEGEEVDYFDLVALPTAQQWIERLAGE